MKIVGMVQSFNEVEKGHFKNLLQYTKWLDEIIFLDDASTDGTDEEIIKLLKPEFHSKAPEDKFDLAIEGEFETGCKLGYIRNKENNWDKQKETTNKKILLDLVVASDPDWIVSFDMDELYEPIWLKNYKSVLKYCELSDIDSLCFYWVHFWLNNGWYRVDSGLSHISPPRIWRNKGSQEIKEEQGLHRQLWPDMANKKVLQDYCLLHYSSSSKEKLIEKIKSYKKLDDTRDYASVLNDIKLEKAKKKWIPKLADDVPIPDFNKIHEEIKKEI